MEVFVDRPILGFERILKQITHMDIHCVEIPTVGRSTRMHCVYQNLDNIYLRNRSIYVTFVRERRFCKKMEDNI